MPHEPLGEGESAERGAVAAGLGNRSTERDGDPRDHEDIRAPMPLAVDRALAFVDRNTRHPMHIVGADRARLDEYPVDALREALVNALAHRQDELEAKIADYIARYNEHAHPYNWSTKSVARVMATTDEQLRAAC